MRILLMLSLRDNKNKDFFYVPDLGLLYLATALKASFGEKVQIKILVDNLHMSENDFGEFLVFNDFDLVGIKVFSSTLRGAQKTIRLLKHYLPHATIIAGGPHVNALPKEALNEHEIDYAIHGDGEEGLVKFIDLFIDGLISPENLKSIPGLIWRQNYDICVNDKAILRDLDCFGIPDWSCMSPSSFPRFKTRSCRSYPAAAISITRGCPSRCIFCSESGSPFRKRDLGKVMNELNILKRKHGVKEFHILDNNCASHKDYFLAFCKELLAHRIDLPWRIPGGICINSIDEEMCAFMKKSGCYQIWVGIENGSQRILNMMRKGITVTEIGKTIKMVKRYKILVGGWFILGYPGETDDDRKLTRDLALSLPLDYAKFTIFIPQPGSEMFERLKEEGKITDLKEVLFCGDNQFENNLTNLSPQQLRKVHRNFSLSFYARPRVITHLLKEYSSPREIAYLVKNANQFVFSKTQSW